MPVVFEEKLNRRLEDKRKAIFHLWIHSEDLSDKDEGCFTCDVKTYSDGKIDGEYYRKFLVRNYNKQHFSKFVEKFCTDANYREQFNINHDKQIQNEKGIDPEIKDLVNSLNDIGLKTIYSCQGTKNEFSDRPRQTDGHSILAYVYFQKSLPPIFLKLVGLYDLFLTINNNTIYAKKRKFNEYFNPILIKVIEEYKLTQRL